VATSGVDKKIGFTNRTIWKQDNVYAPDLWLPPSNGDGDYQR
jgi:hypothetical protein